MNSREETLEALNFILSEKIYPMRPDLIRNDSLTANLVLAYAKAMADFYYTFLHYHTVPSEELLDAAFKVNDQVCILADMQPATIRKYISKLWASGALSQSLKFETVKSPLE